MLEDKMYVKQMEKSNKSYMEKSRTKNKIPIAIPFPLYPKKFLYSFQAKYLHGILICTPIIMFSVTYLQALCWIRCISCIILYHA